MWRDIPRDGLPLLLTQRLTARHAGLFTAYRHVRCVAIESLSVTSGCWWLVLPHLPHLINADNTG